MGTLILISGPNGSGKSRFAENLIAMTARRGRYYIATMVPVTEENNARIAAHRRQRASLGFVTLENPGPVGEAAVPPGAAVLLEDVSNLLANALFDGIDKPEERAEAVSEEVLRDLLRLRDRCGLLAAVTVSGLDPAGYAGETAAYILALNRLNRSLLAAAEAAAELREGAPRWVKGEGVACGDGGKRIIGI